MFDSCSSYYLNSMTMHELILRRNNSTIHACNFLSCILKIVSWSNCNDWKTKSPPILTIFRYKYDESLPQLRGDLSNRKSHGMRGISSVFYRCAKKTHPRRFFLMGSGMKIPFWPEYPMKNPIHPVTNLVINQTVFVAKTSVTLHHSSLFVSFPQLPPTTFWRNEF